MRLTPPGLSIGSAACMSPPMLRQQPSVVSHKSLYFDCHSERSEESRLFKYMRPFTEFTLRLFTSFRVTDEGFRVTRKNLFQHPANVKKRWTHYTSFFVTDAEKGFYVSL